MFHGMDIPHFAHLWKDTWDISKFWLLWIKLLWTFTHRVLYEHKFSYLWDKYLRVHFWIIGLWIIVFGFIRSYQTVSQFGCIISHSYQQCVGDPVSSCHCQHLVLSLFYFHYSDGFAVVAHCGFDSPFLLAKMWGIFSSCAFNTWFHLYVFFGELFAFKGGGSLIQLLESNWLKSFYIRWP